MKKLIAALCMVMFAMGITAQTSNLIIFSQEGERFQLVLNGILQNADPETNVMISELVAPSYKLKVIFEAEVPDLDKTVYFSNGVSEDTYMIKKNRKGEYVLRFQNSVPIAQAPPPPANRVRYVYTTTAPAATTVSSVQTQTTTTTSVSAPGTSASVEVSAGMAGMNVSMNINETNTTTTHTTSSTTVTTTGVAAGQGEAVYVLPGYDGYYGCPYPMHEDDFRMAKESIASKDFSDSKITVARQVLSNNCLLTSQVRELLGLFDFEDDKLEIAKAAYGSTLDVGNYFRVNDVFEFESTIEELDEYIRNFRR